MGKVKNPEMFSDLTHEELNVPYATLGRGAATTTAWLPRSGKSVRMLPCRGRRDPSRVRRGKGAGKGRGRRAS
jgi:hypothetical protein